MNNAYWVNENIVWTPWINLFESWKNPIIPKKLGLYRIRRTNSDELDYIGQTSGQNMDLRKRLGMLKGVFNEEMPYRDPHTVGPALWALKHKYNCDFEVSVTPIEGSKSWIKGMEAVALSLYRAEKNKSPNFNFGRMPIGYKMSSSNNSKLVNSGKRFRGGICEDKLLCHESGINPTGSLISNVSDFSWCGFDWSDWIPVEKVFSEIKDKSFGLYRIKKRNESVILYIGQGLIKDRIRNHTNKHNINGHNQAEIFSPISDLEFSWVNIDTKFSHHLLELENDLIASHIIMTKQIPAAQFIG